MRDLPATSIAAIVVVVLLVPAGCQTVSNIAPSITEITQIPDMETYTNAAHVSASAHFSYKDWGYVRPYFSVASDPASLFDHHVARVADPVCAPVEQGSATHRCTVALQLPPGTWYYQWHLDYGRTSADAAVLSRPHPPTQSFTVRRKTITNGPPPPPPPSSGEPLVLHDPADGDLCTGALSGGSVIAPVSWRAQSTGEGVSIGGTYQMMVEHPAPPNCADAQSQGLDISQTNAAWGYTTQGGCYFTYTNNNSSVTPALRPNRDYRVRVRRIQDDNSFGAWTAYNSFRTAGPPTQPPVFEYPVDGAVVDMPNTVAAQSVEFLWRAEGCRPTSYTLRLFRGQQTAPVKTLQGMCNWNGDPHLCRAQTGVERGASFRVELVQANAWGSIQSEMRFSTR